MLASKCTRLLVGHVYFIFARLLQMIEYQDQVEAVVVEYDGKNVTWQDVCYKPIPGERAFNM